MANCELLPILDFSKIAGEEITLPDECQLSTDQKYLLDAYQAITSGTCLDDVSYCKFSNIFRARWFTTENRLLRLYMSTSNPSHILKLIIHFIIAVYIPVWFSI